METIGALVNTVLTEASKAAKPDPDAALVDSFKAVCSELNRIIRTADSSATAHAARSYLFSVSRCMKFALLVRDDQRNRPKSQMPIAPR